VTKMTGSISDDWIYWHLGYKFFHNYNQYRAIADLHTHGSSPGNTIKAQEL
jgi:hypothetical protein